MAHQDYVSRSRSNKKNSPYKAQVQSGGLDAKFKFLSLLSIIALAGFSYFLWSLSQVEPATTSLKSSFNKVKNNTQKSEELPAPPKEKWQYIEELKNKEVEVGEYEVSNKGPYQMQCGSFKSESQAQTLKANIAFAGIESSVKKTTGKNGIYYKVILGPYERKRQAERDKHKLKSNNINYCQIWLWR
jgi:cell division protein FtsN